MWTGVYWAKTYWTGRYWNPVAAVVAAIRARMVGYYVDVNRQGVQQDGSQ